MKNLKKAGISIIGIIMISIQLLSVNVFAESQYKTMYLVSSQKVKYYVGNSDDFTERITYKDGLMSKVKRTGYHSSVQTYKYDSSGNMIDDIFTYDSKGRVIAHDNYRYKYNKAGKLAKIEFSNDDITYTYEKYTYKKNKLVSWKSGSSERNNIKYDKKGYIKSYSTVLKMGFKPIKNRFKVKNTYKKGRLVKSVSMRKGSGNKYIKESVSTYKYKKVKVPKKYVAKIKAQQMYLKGQLLVPYFAIS